MKKFVLLLAAVFFFTVSASEEAVKKTVIFYRQAIARLDGLTALTVCAPEYVEINNNSTIDYEKTRQVAVSLQNMVKSEDLEEIFGIYKQIIGQSITSEELVKIRAMKGTPEEKKNVEQIKKYFKILIDVSSNIVKNMRIEGIKIDGDRAVARQVIVHPESNQNLYTDYQLVKRTGKWLITKVIEGGVQ